MAYPNISRLDELRDLASSGDISGLAGVVAKMAKQLNQRFYRMERKGIQKSSYGYSTAKDFTGKEKPRYSQSFNKLAQMDGGELYEMALDINAKLFSSSTTISGLAEIEHNRLSKAADRLRNYGVDLDATDLKKFLDLGGGEFLNSKYLDSVQILEDFAEMTKNGNLTPKEFLREFKRYKKRLQDGADIGKVDIYGNIRRNLLNKSKRKEL